MRGQGRVYRQKKSRFWWIAFYANGKEVRQSARTTNKTDAARLLRQKLADVDGGKLVLPKQERLTVNQLLDMLVEDHEINNRKGVYVLRCQIKVLRKELGCVRGRELTERHLARYTAERLKDGYKPATINKQLGALRRAYNLARKRKLLRSAPSFEMLAENNARQGFFEEEQYRAVLKHLPGHLPPLLTFFYRTGWRLSEVLNLRWHHVDFEHGVVRLEVGTTKNNEGRVFPFAALPDLKDALEAQRKRAVEMERELARIVPWVFFRPNGEQLRNFRAAWKKATEKAGCPGLLVHDCRRTAVRALERANVPRSVAMKLTGHRTESTFRRYSIVAERDLAEGVERLAAASKMRKKKPGDSRA